MDKNTIIGFILIIAVLIGFTWLSKPSNEELAERRKQLERDSIEHAQLKQVEQNNTLKDSISLSGSAVDSFFASSSSVQTDSTQQIQDSTATLQPVSPQKEEIISLENNKLKIDFSTKGGQMISAQVKNFTRFDDDSLYLFNTTDATSYLQLRNKQGRALQTKDLMFSPTLSKDGRSLIMRYAYSSTQHIDFIYTLATDDYMLKFDINIVGMEELMDRESAGMFEYHWIQKLRRQEKSIKNEQRYSHIYYKYVGDDVVEMSNNKNETKEASEPTKWVAFKDQYFSSVLIADEEFKTILLESRILASNDYLKFYDATTYTQAKFDAKDNSLQGGYTFFLGPLQYSNLRSYDDNIKDANKQLDLDKLVPLGWTLFRWVNQYFVIPVFNILADTGLSMGIIILLLTLIVKLIISPLTYKSFKSSAKMRVLRPQVEELNEKYPKPEQATEKQQAVMALYSRAGANPMSGCIPLLLQMPILIALFQFFPSAIELRHQSFLWATDLSTYDAIFEWTANIPVISWALGNHISLFCILMTATNIVYTKFNMEMTNTGQQQMPGMKWMMYLMPLIFLFVLNDYPSGLTYYYFLSLLITIVLTIAFRYTINEDKLLAKMEENKKKPRKKSGFMARLEEAQRIQQQQLREKNKTNSTKRKR